MPPLYFPGVILISIFFIAMAKSQGAEVTRVHSEINGHSYVVQNLKDKKAAANMLAELHLKINQLIALLLNSDGDNPAVKRLARNFQGKISERTPENIYTSYTVNKGEHVHMCIREKDNRLTDLNTIFFVALHEMAHIMTRSNGHTPEFRTNFKFLLQRSIEYNLYKYERYQDNPKSYCGIQIKNNPL